MNYSQGNSQQKASASTHLIVTVNQQGPEWGRVSVVNPVTGLPFSLNQDLGAMLPDQHRYLVKLTVQIEVLETSPLPHSLIEAQETPNPGVLVEPPTDDDAENF